MGFMDTGSGSKKPKRGRKAVLLRTNLALLSFVLAWLPGPSPSQHTGFIDNYKHVCAIHTHTQTTAWITCHIHLCLQHTCIHHIPTHNCTFHTLMDTHTLDMYRHRHSHTIPGTCTHIQHTHTCADTTHTPLLRFSRLPLLLPFIRDPHGHSYLYLSVPLFESFGS